MAKQKTNKRRNKRTNKRTNNSNKSGQIKYRKVEGNEKGEEQHVWPFIRPLRSSLMKERNRELSWVLKLQSLRSRILDIWMITSSAFCEEMGLIMVLPACSWVIDMYLTVHMVVMVALDIAIGNYFKNILLVPRPASPPAWRYNKESDYGTPSTHTMNGACMPFILFWYFFIHHNALHTSIPSIFVVAFATLFALNIGVSRVYLGAHNPLDVISGFILFPIIYTIYMNWGSLLVEGAIFHKGIYVFLVFPICALFLYIHPRGPSPNSSVPESGLILGTCTGTIVSVWVTRHYRQMFPAAFLLVDVGSHLSYPWLMFARITIGAIVAVATRFIVKGTATVLIKTLWKSIKYSNIDKEKNKKKTKGNGNDIVKSDGDLLTEEDLHDIKIVVKYLTYFAIALGCHAISMWYMFPLFGLSYSEVDDLLSWPQYPR